MWDVMLILAAVVVGVLWALRKCWCDAFDGDKE